MERLMQPDQLRTRILLWAEEGIRLGHLLPNSGGILEAVLYRGELPRGFGPTRTQRSHLGKHTRTAAPGASGSPRLTLDAGPVSGKGELSGLM